MAFEYIDIAGAQTDISRTIEAATSMARPYLIVQKRLPKISGINLGPEVCEGFGGGLG